MKPYLRAVKYGWLRRRAERAAARARPVDEPPDPAPVAWILGCGRSGTTMLGDVLGRHPDVCYLFEPGYLWAAIDPETDFFNLYHRVDGRCFMDAVDAGPGARRRFGRLMLGPLRRSGRRLLVEKTPINTLRIGYLEALAPHARHVHLARDGVDVCRSIERLSTTNAYRIAGRPSFHQWWGVRDAKWRALRRDGLAAGYYPDEVDRLDGHLARGAYEWLLSMHEIDRWRGELGGRLLEIRYQDLTADPRGVLARIGSFLELETPGAWLEEAAAAVGPARRNPGGTVELPPAMAKAFNELQQRWGFENRAVAKGGESA